MRTFLKQLFRPTELLVELSSSMVRVKVFSSNVMVEMEPYIAVRFDGKEKLVAAVGKDAKHLSGEDTTVSNPFESLVWDVHDAQLAEKILQFAVLEIHIQRKMGFSPRAIVHLIENKQPLSVDMVERIKQAVLGAGVRDVSVYQGERINPQLDTYKSIREKCMST